MAHTLEVHLHDRLAGHLVDGGRDGWVFAYADAALADDWPWPYPISLALPRQRRPHRGDAVSGVFTNLLPEGDIRRRLALALGLSADNDFALLGRIAGDCHGALSLRPPGLRPRTPQPVKKLDESELRNAMAVLPAHPLLVDAEGLRAVLPGEFDKLPVRVIDGRVHILRDDRLSTHIVKPARPGLRESVANEAFTMELAAAYGLPVAACEMIPGPIAILSVTRIDRVPGEPVRARHMEDFCQLAGLASMRKYEREGGLRLADIAGLLRRFSAAPALDLRALTRWTIFSFLVGFGAAHSKQLALLFDDAGPRLAPFYGLWSTHVYSEMSDCMGFAIGGEDRPDWLTARRWIEFAREVGIRPAYVLAQMREAATRLPALAIEVAASRQRRDGYAGIVGRITTLLAQRARQMLVSLEAERIPG